MAITDEQVLALLGRGFQIKMFERGTWIVFYHQPAASELRAVLDILPDVGDDHFNIAGPSGPDHEWRIWIAEKNGRE